VSIDVEVQAVQRMLGRERLSCDRFEPGRTTFLSHLGSTARLIPGPWIAHRDLVYEMALSNLSPTQRSALAKSVLAEHEREFGVGRLRLVSHPSGLPFGGSALHMRPRGDGPNALYTWAIGHEAARVEVEWLLLRAQPEWALDRGPRAMTARGVETLVGLGGVVLILVPSAVAARQVADHLVASVAVGGHPRFAPHLTDPDPAAAVMLWPHDGIDSPKLNKLPAGAVTTAVLIDAAEPVRAAVLAWAQDQTRVEVVDRACPGRVARDGLLKFWEGCGRPKVLLRGDPAWAGEGQRWLESAGVTVARQTAGTQLGLF
jgi:hypothetical protein